MIAHGRPAVALLAALLVAPFAGARPAYADGAASTRNIIFGAAAATAATLMIINHNKKVHERYAEDARRQAQLEGERNNIQAAYDSERQAYANEAALVASYQHEVAVQHEEVLRERGEISALKHQLAVARVPARQTAQSAQRATVAQQTPQSSGHPAPVIAYGWGTL